MKRPKLFIIVSVILAAAIYCTATAYAASSMTSTGKGPSLSDSVKTALDTLVTAGTITSDQETAILEALRPSDKQTSDKQSDQQPGQRTDRIKTRWMPLSLPEPSPPTRKPLS